MLFDTGLHPDLRHDPHARLGFLADVFGTELGDGDVVGARLAAHGVAADRLRHVVLSHLHFDHAGGLASLPNARVIVQRRDWEAGHDPDLAGALGFATQDFDHGHDVLLVDGEHDLFGDGRVVCLPTHGHTPGHQSLRVRLDGGDVVLTADACYLKRTLETDSPAAAAVRSRRDARVAAPPARAARRRRAHRLRARRGGVGERAGRDALGGSSARRVIIARRRSVAHRAPAART